MIKRLVKIFLVLLTGYLIAFILSRERTYTFIFQRDSLKNQVEPIVQNSQGSYGIFIKNLITDESFLQNEHQIFDPGSLYKIWVMAASFEKIKSGEIEEDEQLIADVAKLNEKFDIDEEDAEFQEGIIDFSVKSAIEQMITISHNYAALSLLDKIGSSQVTSFLERYGFGQSSLGNPPKTSAKDIASFFEKLYMSEIIDSEYSQKMMDILAKQKINDKIPKYLPEGTRVAHKTGDIGFFEHDAGIVFSPKDNFIIIVLSETKDPSQAGDTIARISEAVYKYFNKE